MQRKSVDMYSRVSINPIWTGGAIMAGTTEDRLPFPHGLRCAHQISWLCCFYCFTSLRRVIFWKKKFFAKNIERRQKYPKTLLCKNQNFQKKILFLENVIFSAWIWIVHDLSFLLRYISHLQHKISNFCHFFHEIFNFDLPC